MDPQELDQRLRDMQHEYLDFLDDEEDQGKYATLVKNMVADHSLRLVVNVNDLRRKNPARAAALLTNAFEEHSAFQKALKEYVYTVAHDYAKENDEFFIAFEGSFGNKHVTPRSLTSRFLGNLVCVEGIVTKCSLVHPKVVRSVHFCPVTKKVMERKYTDLTSLDAFPTSSVYPTKDEDGNLLETEFGLSVYKDHQTISIQEMPEKAPAGQLPRSVDIICDNDLVDRCKPGDRIQVVGNYRCLPNKQGSFTNGIFRTVVIASNVSQLSKEANPSISREDVAKCKNLAKSNKNVFELLAKSLAPSIHGHEYIKKAILCLLLGGVEKILPNGTRLRGDINVLLIGDPSVAKSQLLRYVLCTAPRAIPTTGRGSSGVGLTAAVTTDQETGERRLEAGAMVLADRGVVCIDEFDKMSDMDRTAIHEVMEQGRVTIAKAGIHASLNARCSVLAAANPVYGKYDQYKTPMENIGLQDSLLSRFDLLFVMLDSVDEDHDLMISDHVVRMHRYRNPGEQDGEVLPMGSSVDMLSTMRPEEVDDDKVTPMYEKYDALLHGESRKKTDKILSVDFMRKYIHFVKILKPTLTEQASEIIADEYSKLRSEDVLENHVARTQPVTPRTLETMIRLATAHAKARMSRTVTAQDAYAAIELVQYAYFKKVLEKEKKRRRNAQSESENEEMEEESQRTKKSRQEVEESEEEMETETIEIDSTPAMITSERLTQFRSSLDRAFRDNRAQSLSLARIRDSVNTDNIAPFSQGEIRAAIDQMTEANQVMLADGIVFLI
ncbi:DNA replication licensing factor Mcm3 [Tribolium castaneum]|uniref:DNA replication licensing factor MCM3 n=1 Tax=Tribolium castaneum TaxID=7070 RepID=D7EIV8_TRICA|nr:PREDICTED: DNA replication licensing factor Mcm3 [Tribolium castaneum]EFA12381.1 DNA replication licensing factor Mcm3-like Protein [Tribolium castaneum]|eukprot:XP_968641.2 PREDICTED: DNA replication licensing factor Mcm3 [Tribolium castaneum]